jgi:hydroxyacylglutathione hydrolase
MLTVSRLTYNDFQENTYIITNHLNDCWVVDPGMAYANERQRFAAHIAGLGLTPRAIINTHAHIDHIFGVQFVKDQYSIPFGVHEAENQVLDYAVSSAAVFGLDLTEAPTPDFLIAAGLPMPLGEDEIQVLHCPGHSPGSLVFYYAPGNWAIGGDVLFQGSIGRTDLPGGDFDTLIHSIQQNLFLLPDNVVVYPGHGPATTIGHEKHNNPFCRVG